MSVKPLGKREEAKNRNKDRIIAAARQLMQAPGGTLSMRELADMAGVSVATPYNLFGSKQEVIVAVLDDDVQALQQSVSDVGGDPIDGFFGVIDVSVGMLASAPAFYRTGARAVQTDMMDGDLQRHLREPRHTVLRQLVQRAVQQGFISHKISVDIFAVQLGQTLMIWVQSWANDHVTLDQLSDYLTYAFALSLAGVVADEHKQRVLDKAWAVQDRLQDDWPVAGQLPISVAG
ncbi:MAG: TetR/AcrR family transcriptional regulator [Alphaproteobacteria bacterium]